MPLHLRLLGRQDCPLCDEMMLALSGISGPELVVESVNIDDDPVLLRRYGLRIPVLLDAWNDVICEGHFDAAAYSDWRREQARRSER